MRRKPPIESPGRVSAGADDDTRSTDYSRPWLLLCAGAESHSHTVISWQLWMGGWQRVLFDQFSVKLRVLRPAGNRHTGAN